MYERPSTSTSSAPAPLATKSGSRPIERIARTGELTPPGSTARARSNSGALSFPALEVVGEVEEPDLLELGRRVERRAVVDAGLGGDRVEDGVALVLRAPVGHREDRVGPVLVRRPLVAVRDAAERGHAPAVLELLARGDPPDAHAVRAEPRAAMEEDRRHAPEEAALAHALEVLEEARLRHPELGRGGCVRLGHDRHVAL